MKRCFFILTNWLLACFTHLAYAQSESPVSQFIPNPSFQVTYNELEAAKTMRKYGQESVILTPTEDVKKLAEKLNRDTTIHSKIDGWVFWKDLNSATNTNRQNEKIKNRAQTVVLDAGKAHFLGTYLNAPLEAGKVYTLVLKFHEPTNSTPLPPLGFAILPTIPTDVQARIVPNKIHKFKYNKDAKHHDKRKSIVSSYTKEYGGNYDTKEWRDFQGIKTYKESIETVTLTFRAKGGEMYLVFGNFEANANSQNTTLLALYRLHLYDKDNFSSVED